MNALTLSMILLSQGCLAAGQILIKKSVDVTNQIPICWSRFFAYLTLGIGITTLWFLLWLGLMQRFHLSYLYPFEGLSPPLLVLGASLFLKEKTTLRLWLGVLLIGVGVSFVATS